MWLGGADYVECPQCLGTRRLVLEEHRVRARARTVFVPGQRPFEVVDLPQRSLVADSFVERK